MKKLIPFLFLLIIQSLSAQTFTETIRGKVIDVDSKSPIFGANIILLNSDSIIGATTDVDGNFRLTKVPVGRQAVKITSLGYEDAVLSNIIVSSAKQVILNIELREKVYTTGTVEVVAETDKTKANNDMVSVSSRNFQKEETERYAGSRGDPSKMVTNYAGVSSGNDARNDIIVRGNSPLGVLWRLEGVDIPNPNHFSAQGATGGPISMLNNNLLGNSDFLTGAFPAEYGNKTAAVFDLKLRNGNNERHELTEQIGINGIEVGAEGPISKKDGSSYLINYRYSTLQVFNDLGIRFGVSASPEYQDVCYKVNIPTKKSGVFTFWGIGGLSKLSLLDSDLKSTDWSYIKQGQDLYFKSSMGAAGISNLYFFNTKVSGKITLSFSATNLNAYVDTITPVTKATFLDRKNYSTETNAIADYTLTDKINAHHLIKAGVNFQEIFFNATAFIYSTVYNQNIYSLKVNNASAGFVQSFLEWQWRPVDKLVINTGIHFQDFLLNNTNALEPRIGMRYQLTEKQSISLGYGMHSMMQPTVYYFYTNYNPINDSYYNSNRNLDLTKSQHIVLGYDYNFAKNFRIKFETYYQYLYNVPVQTNESTAFSMLNVGNQLEGIPLVDSLTNKGTGTNYGVELTIEKFFSKHFYFLATASLYNSEYKGSNGVTHKTSYDGGYVFNALAGYELPLDKNKNKSLSLDLKYTQAGGNRYTPIDMEKSKLMNKQIFIDNEAFTQTYKDYSRFDVKLSYKTNRKKTSQIIFITVENIFNTQNILEETYNTTTQSIQKEYQLGLFPYGGYRIEF